MATTKHRPSPLVEPPSSSSSSSEENDRNASSQKPEEEQDSSDDDSSSEEETEEVHARNASSQKPKEEDSSDDDSSSEEETYEVHVRNASCQKPEEEEDSSDDDSCSEEETEEVHASIKPPPPALTSNPKPASSESESDSKPKPEPTPPPTKSGTKRAMENTNTESDSKRSKKKAIAGNGSDDDEKEEEKDLKKSPSHRLFSEEDELAILKGLADFISKTGKDPVKHTRAFYSFVKESIQADSNKEQLRRKIRSLKNKYESNEDFTKQHDKDAFELFQKIDFKVKKEGSTSDLEKSLAFIEMVRFGDEMRSYGLNMPAMKKGMELIGESNKAVLEERLKNVEIAEMKLLIARAELVRDQASLILEAYNNSN
ncbi:unnamed protein product [Lathyrus sativus]|nr:unnamed protein product [Lathyrus sativus]